MRLGASRGHHHAPLPNPPPPAPLPTLAIPGNQMIRYTNTQGLQSDMKTFAIVVLSPYETTDLGVLRAASPATLALAYQDATCVANAANNPTLATASNPVSLGEAQAWDAAHPTDRWLMYSDAAGTALVTVGADHLTNLGSLTYQARVAARLQEVHDLGVHYDGIHYDNTNSKYTHRTTNGVQGYVTPPSPGPLAVLTDAQWKTNMIAFLSYQRAAVPSFYLLANAGEQSDDTGTPTKSWWDSIYPYLDGLQMEFFVMNGGSGHPMTYNDPSTFLGHYNARLTVVDKAYSLGRDFVAGASGNGATDLVKMTYAKAAFLLKWDGVVRAKGVGSAAFYENIVPSTTYIQDSFTTWIGTPTGAMVGDGLDVSATGWKRTYTNGIALVNANKPGGGDVTFTLGATYYDPSNNPRTSVTLNPVTAMILTTEPR